MELQQLWNMEADANSSAHPHEFLGEQGFKLVQGNITGTWRWGTLNEDVFKNEDNVLIGIKYRDSVGDTELDAADMNVEFYPVVKRQNISDRYIRVDKPLEW